VVSFLELQMVITDHHLRSIVLLELVAAEAAAGLVVVLDQD
jgi:hypothetical protein